MTNGKNNSACNFRTSIGGQALIEGILMRGPEKQAIVCRTANGLVEKVEELKLVKSKHPILGWPLIRGGVIFMDSMAKGVKALMWSAEQIPEEEQEKPSKFDMWVEKKFGSDKANQFLITTAVVLGIGLSVGLFILLPTILAGFISADTDHFTRNLTEGLVRIVIFLAYLWACTGMKEVKRLFAYHGAEHKTIFCYEAGLPLTVGNVRIQSRFHPRCGTSFLFVVIIVSILVFSVVSWSNVWIRMGLRLLLLPLVVGISYEINRWVGRHDNLLSSVLAWPGKKLQNLTTAEPEDGMIECAIRALELVIPEERGADAW